MATNPRTARLGAWEIVIGISLVLLATACTAPAASPTRSPPPPVTVILEESTFVPPGGETMDGVPALTIPIGTSVTWSNRDPLDHTATEYLDGFPKPDGRFDLRLAPGASGSYTFEEAGTFEVGCVPHPVMQMLVIVE
jgi:plastocyanin